MNLRTLLTGEMAAVVAGRVLLTLSGIGVLSALVAILDAREYSIYVLLFSTASWLSALCFAASNIPIVNFTATEAAGERIRHRSSESAVYFLSLASFPIACLTCALGAWAVLGLGSTDDVEPSIALCSFIGLLSGSIGCLAIISSALMGQRRRIANTICTAGALFLRLSFIGIVYFSLSSSDTGVVQFYAVAGAAALAYFLAMSFAFDRRSRAFRSSVLSPLLRGGFVSEYKHNWPAAIGNNLFVHGDKVVLALVLPIEAIGILSIYQQYCRMLANLSSGTIYQYFAPMLLGKGSGEATGHRFVFASIVSFVSYVCVSVPAFFALEWVNVNVLSDKFDLSPVAYFTVAMTVALTSTSRVAELQFFEKGRVDLLKNSIGLAALFFLGFGVASAYVFGLPGALVGLLAASAVRLAATSYFSRRYLN